VVVNCGEIKPEPVASAPITSVGAESEVVKSSGIPEASKNPKEEVKGIDKLREEKRSRSSSSSSSRSS
jgi:hypothetical protein